ncbi:TylF/MycF/NovP-related O-methyltransferase [Nocardia sp. CA-107356]|uniref:TylF/MycF/NovP-related O-methyltransferase n=1 Tax=Nocardia sp. CA-107356 TaxID=3239972 RepID=UPI003D8BCB1E
MTETRELYMNLMKRVLTSLIDEDAPLQTFDFGDGTAPADLRLVGRDWPTVAHTMVGSKRLDNLQLCAETVIREGIPGDFIEAGRLTSRADRSPPPNRRYSAMSVRLLSLHGPPARSVSGVDGRGSLGHKRRSRMAEPPQGVRAIPHNSETADR